MLSLSTFVFFVIFDKIFIFPCLIGFVSIVFLIKSKNTEYGLFLTLFSLAAYIAISNNSFNQEKIINFFLMVLILKFWFGETIKVIQSYNRFTKSREDFALMFDQRFILKKN